MRSNLKHLLFSKMENCGAQPQDLSVAATLRSLSHIPAPVSRMERRGAQRPMGKVGGKERTREEGKREETYCHLFRALGPPANLSCQPYCPPS